MYICKYISIDRVLWNDNKLFRTNDYQVATRMTLLDLLNKVNNIGSQFNTLSVPLMKDGFPVEFDLEIGGSYEEGYYVNMIKFKEGNMKKTKKPWHRLKTKNSTKP